MLSTSLNLPNSPSQLLGRSQDPLLEKHHRVPVQHHSGILPAFPPHSSVTNIPVPEISAACPKEPSKYPLWQNPQGSALMSKVSFLFKSLEMTRGNIWYKKHWDLVPAAESHECHPNPSHIKACADVYFAHRQTSISLNAYFGFLLMEYYFKSKTKKKKHNTLRTQVLRPFKA